jgi:transcriptional regulator with XRE-family HTH domain
MASSRVHSDPRTRRFGQLIRSLRRARGLSQAKLAELADLSPDTIRRLERGAFSPSLDTLFKLVAGLSLELSTLFTAFELPDQAVEYEVLALIEGFTAEELELAQRVLSLLSSVVQKVVDARSEHGPRSE